MPSDIPEPVKLRSRIAQLCAAEMRQDWLSWYNLTTLKNDISYDEFKEEFRKNATSYKILSCNTERFVAKPVPEYQKRDIKAIVAVEMDVRVTRGYSKPEKIKDLTDYWVYSGGLWYWTWRGFPAD
jgi:hypothetical protein